MKRFLLKTAAENYFAIVSTLPLLPLVGEVVVQLSSLNLSESPTAVVFENHPSAEGFRVLHDNNFNDATEGIYDELMEDGWVVLHDDMYEAIKPYIERTDTEFTVCSTGHWFVRILNEDFLADTDSIRLEQTERMLS